MSSTNAGSTGHERQADDWYVTPEWATRAILPHVHCESSRILDPCAGDGAILRAVDSWCREADAAGHDMQYRSLRGFELDAGRAAEARSLGLDVLTGDCFEQMWAADLVIMNPPFSHAMEMTTRAIEAVAPHVGEVAVLLRLNWLASAGRTPFHRKHPAEIFVLPKRPSFCASITCRTKGGGCGWHVTQKIDAPRPRSCPACGASRLQVTTSDSIEYCWMVFGNDRGGRWSILDV